MNYTMLIYLDEKSFSALPAEEQNRVHRACGAWHDDLVRSGHTHSCLGLESAARTKTLRSSDGKILTIDGPFIEAKEVLGGLERLVCRDLDEALAIARRFPGLLSGHCTLEVRPEVAGGQCEAP